MPANPFQVSVYLQCLILEANSPSPVLNAVYSIDWAQQLAGLPKVSVHPMVSAMVSASQRILGKAKSKKEPITPEMLRALVSSKISDKSPSLSDLRTVALCLIGYAGFFVSVSYALFELVTLSFFLLINRAAMGRARFLLYTGFIIVTFNHATCDVYSPKAVKTFMYGKCFEYCFLFCVESIFSFGFIEVLDPKLT